MGTSTGGIARLIGLFLVVSVVPLALLTYFSVHLASNAVRQEVEARLISSAALSAAAVREEMRGLSDLVESYAKRPHLVDVLSRPGSLDRKELSRQLTELWEARSGIATAFLAAPDGTLIDIVPSTPSIVGKDFSYRDWYGGVTSTGQTYLSEAYESLASGTHSSCLRPPSSGGPDRGPSPAPSWASSSRPTTSEPSSASPADSPLHRGSR